MQDTNIVMHKSRDLSGRRQAELQTTSIKPESLDKIMSVVDWRSYRLSKLTLTLLLACLLTHAGSVLLLLSHLAAVV